MAYLKPCHLSVEVLKTRLVYDPETGQFFTLMGGKKRVGSVTRGGYVRILVDGQFYFAHRLGWYFVHGEWPSNIVDHINRDRADNRISNLRVAGYSANNRNRRSINQFGMTGVHRAKDKARYQSSISDKGRRRYLGTFDTPEGAHAAYVKAYHELEKATP